MGFKLDRNIQKYEKIKHQLADWEQICQKVGVVLGKTWWAFIKTGIKERMKQVNLHWEQIWQQQQKQKVELFWSKTWWVFN